MPVSLFNDDDAINLCPSFAILFIYLFIWKYRVENSIKDEITSKYKVYNQ